MIYAPSGRDLPAVLTRSDVWIDLNEVQQKNFAARLNYFEEICTKCNEWLFEQGVFSDNLDFLDQIERDLLVNLPSSQPERTVSPWLIHSSWTFDTTPAELLDALPQEVAPLLSDTEIGFACSESEFRGWLEQRVESFRILMEGFYGSERFSEMIACLIGLNVSLCSMLQGVIKQRMNQALMTA